MRIRVGGYGRLHDAGDLLSIRINDEIAVELHAHRAARMGLYGQDIVMDGQPLDEQAVVCHQKDDPIRLQPLIADPQLPKVLFAGLLRHAQQDAQFDLFVCAHLVAGDLHRPAEFFYCNHPTPPCHVLFHGK